MGTKRKSKIIIARTIFSMMYILLILPPVSLAQTTYPYCVPPQVKYKVVTENAGSSIFHGNVNATLTANCSFQLIGFIHGHTQCKWLMSCGGTTVPYITDFGTTTPPNIPTLYHSGGCYTISDGISTIGIAGSGCGSIPYGNLSTHKALNCSKENKSSECFKGNCYQLDMTLGNNSGSCS